MRARVLVGLAAVLSGIAAGCPDIPQRHFPPLDPLLGESTGGAVLLFLTRDTDDGRRTGLLPGQYSFARVVCNETWADPLNSVARTVASRPAAEYDVITYGREFSFPSLSEAVTPVEMQPPAASALCEVVPRDITQAIPCGVAVCVDDECFYEAPIECEQLYVGENPFFYQWVTM